MALEAETTVVVSPRPFLQAAGGGDGGEVSSGTAVPPVLLLAAEKDWPVDEAIWGDEKRMKRELVAWAKAVASMVARKDTTSSPSSSPWLSMSLTRSTG